jgi:hypothetical protein
MGAGGRIGGVLRAGAGRMLFALAVSVALLAPGLAAAGEPVWTADWDEGIEEAKERDCPIVMVAPFKRGTLEPSVFPTVFNDPDVVGLSQRFVCFLADDKRYAKIDTLYAARFVKPDSGKYGSLQVIFCKPDGTEVEKLRLTGDAPKGKVVQNMTAMLKDHPGAISKAEYASCRELKDRAEHLRGLGAYADAVEAYEELGKKKSKLKLVEQAAGKPDELRKEAAEKVEALAAALAGDDADKKKEAIKQLCIYDAGMKGLDAHERVKELLEEVRKDSSVRAEYSQAQKNAKAFEKFAAAEVAFLKGDYKSAAKEYKRILVRMYETTDYYDRAKDRIQEIIKLLTPQDTTP